MNNEIKAVVYVDGIDVESMNDGALFNRIAGMNAELKELNGLGISGPAIAAAKAVLKDKIEDLTSIVNARHEDTDGE